MKTKNIFALLLFVISIFGSFAQAEYRDTTELVTLFKNVVTEKTIYEQLIRNNISMTSVEDLYNQIVTSDMEGVVGHAANSQIVIFVNKNENRIISVIIK